VCPRTRAEQDSFKAKKLGAALVAANLSKILLEHFQDAEK
jgi:hypothetical protein